MSSLKYNEIQAKLIERFVKRNSELDEITAQLIWCTKYAKRFSDHFRKYIND